MFKFLHTTWLTRFKVYVRVPREYAMDKLGVSILQFLFESATDAVEHTTYANCIRNIAGI
jgi:hypothetical protein